MGNNQDDNADNWSHQNGNANADNDEMESDFSDFDQPYHETASDWYVRAARRRARRWAGLSSSSSSSSSSSGGSGSSNECSDLDSGDEFNKKNDNESKGRARKEMEKANRPLAKWLARYPLVAARCCLSSAMTLDTSKVDDRTHFSNSHPPLPERKQEMKKLRRIFRRVHRKQKAFQATFIENHDSASWGPNCSSSYKTAYALSLEEMMGNYKDDTATGCDPSVIHSLLPEGTGISFIDAALGWSYPQSTPASHFSRTEPQTLSRLVLELIGPSRSGITSILLAVAARYVASTSHLFLETVCTARSHGRRSGSPASHPPSKSSGSRQNAGHTLFVNEPHVVILDLEKGVHALKLFFSVREAVLRRWEETARWRDYWKRESRKQSEFYTTNEEAPEENGDTSADTMDEQQQIEQVITSCLGRIHLVQPRDFTYLSLVATIEVLRKSLDKEKLLQNPIAHAREGPSPEFGPTKKNRKQPTINDTRQQEPPTLILIDSLTTLEESTRFQESLPTTLGSNYISSNSGLSERNEFYRQLIRLRDEHEISILGASRSVASVNNKVKEHAPRGTAGRKWGDTSLWSKMVSHRISLHRAAEGTDEDRAGYTFVATLNANDHEGTSFFPYSVTTGGIITSC